MINRLKNRWKILLIGAVVLAVGAAAVGYLGLHFISNARSNSPDPIGRWFSDSTSRAELTTDTQNKACPGAPFILPSAGFIGLLWDDPAGPYTLFAPHSGVDIFGDGEPGTVPVYAAYDGWLSRLDDWVSTVIIRHDDPLQPGRTIWTYYTHMASRDGSESFVDEAFPAGTFNLPIKQGTLLGHQGEYAGGRAPIGMHVHFSIVLSDADGAFTNQDVLSNTLDPSPYLGMDVNSPDLPARPIGCKP